MDFRFIELQLFLYAVAVMLCYFSKSKGQVFAILLLLFVCSFALDWWFFAPL